MDVEAAGAAPTIGPEATTRAADGSSAMPGSVAWAESVLREQGMSREELGAVLATENAEIVRRHLELHLERLEESFAGQRRRAASAQRILTETASAHVSRSRPVIVSSGPPRAGASRTSH
jgi:hypothetical protein